MKREQATAGVAYLVAATTGWTDEAVELTINECMTLHDPEAFIIGCRNLARTWQDARRPFLYHIRVAYEAELRQQQMDMALPMGNDQIPEFKDGVAIAWEAYQDECKRVGKEPNRSYFEQWLPAG